MDKYQKIKDLGLTIDSSYHAANGCHENVVNADKLLKVLDAGVEVYGQIDSDGPYHFQSLKCLSGYADASTHSGLILNLKPLKPKEVTITREDLKTAFSDGFGIVDISYFDVIAKRLGL